MGEGKPARSLCPASPARERLPTQPAVKPPWHAPKNPEPAPSQEDPFVQYTSVEREFSGTILVHVDGFDVNWASGFQGDRIESVNTGPRVIGLTRRAIKQNEEIDIAVRTRIASRLGAVEYNPSKPVAEGAYKGRFGLPKQFFAVHWFGHP